MRAQNMSNTAWAFATCRVADAPLFEAISAAASQIIGEFDIQGLANTLWSLASLSFADLPLFPLIRRTVLPVLLAGAPSHASGQRVDYSEAARFTNHICQMVWSLSFAGRMDDVLAAELRGLLLQTGRALDEAHVGQQGARRGDRSTLPADPSVSEPFLQLRARGISVVLKPPLWEVDAKGQLSSTGRYLSHFMQRRHDRSAHVLHLAEFEYGFVHRLDLPSSGLILAGTTFEGYGLLQWQMHTYDIAREYAVMLRGSVPSSLRDIRAPVSDFLPGRSVVDDAGHPAETHLKVSFHALRRGRRGADRFGLACIAIHTGRRHQIRVHASWEGHPTVTDEKYSHRAAWVSSAGLELDLGAAL